WYRFVSYQYVHAWVQLQWRKGLHSSFASVAYDVAATTKQNHVSKPLRILSIQQIMCSTLQDTFSYKRSQRKSLCHAESMSELQLHVDSYIPAYFCLFCGIRNVSISGRIHP